MEKELCNPQTQPQVMEAVKDMERDLSDKLDNFPFCGEEPIVDGKMEYLIGNKESPSKELIFIDWRKWSLHQKRAYVKGSGGGFNLDRSDIAALDDDYRGMQYTMKTIRMAVDVIDDLSTQLTATQQALDKYMKIAMERFDIIILKNKALDRAMEALKFYANFRWEGGIPYKEPILPPQRPLTLEEARSGIIHERLQMKDKIDTGQKAQAALATIKE